MPTNPNQLQNIPKKRVTKPDGTVSEEFFHPGDFLAASSNPAGIAVRGNSPTQPPAQLAQQLPQAFAVAPDPASIAIRGTQPAQLPSVLPQLQQQQNGGFFNTIAGLLSGAGNFLAQPQNFGALGQIAQAIDPTGFGGRLGAFANSQAQGQLFNQFLQQLLGNSNTNPNIGLSGRAAGVLGPKLQQAALQQFQQQQTAGLADRNLALNALLGLGRLGLTETPEERLNRELAVTLAGKSPAAAKTREVTVNIDKLGRETPPRQKHKWLVDNLGNRIKYLGPSTLPESNTGGSGLAKQRAELAELKHAEDQTFSFFKVFFPDSIIQDQFGNIKFSPSAPESLKQLFRTMIILAVQAKQSRKVLPPVLKYPGIGDISVSGVKPSKEFANLLGGSASPDTSSTNQPDSTGVVPNSNLFKEDY